MKKDKKIVAKILPISVDVSIQLNPEQQVLVEKRKKANAFLKSFPALTAESLRESFKQTA